MYRKGYRVPCVFPLRLTQAHTHAARIIYTHTLRDVCAPETQQWSLLMITKPCVTSRRMPPCTARRCTYSKGCDACILSPPAAPDHAAAVPNFVLREIAFGKLKRVSRCNCRKLTFFKIPLFATATAIRRHPCIIREHQPLETHACSPRIQDFGISPSRAFSSGHNIRIIIT